jgi:hypothetical protein
VKTKEIVNKHYQKYKKKWGTTLSC